MRYLKGNSYRRRIKERNQRQNKRLVRTRLKCIRTRTEQTNRTRLIGVVWCSESIGIPSSFRHVIIRRFNVKFNIQGLMYTYVLHVQHLSVILIGGLWRTHSRFAMIERTYPNDPDSKEWKHSRMRTRDPDPSHKCVS